ncbi:MAG: aspartate aminotransferase family protein [Armatimonadetes bacterium]|nr:aspartate aminotransferase family protein [Armatimonadota bacterium]
MGKPFDLTPRDVAPVHTRLRRIQPPFPHPEAVALIRRLYAAEPVSMQGQPPVVWDRAEGFQVHDPWGNTWLDWSSGVLVANAGHSHPAIKAAIHAQADRDLLHNYCFPSQERLELVELLRSIAPEGLDKVFLLTTGSETTECALKLSRAHGMQVGGRRKSVVVSFGNAFHGRTLGAQLIGGIPALKEWILHLDPGIVQVPFPDGYRVTDTSFDSFLYGLSALGVGPEDVAGVIVETYQGVGPDFLPVEYAQRLRNWCAEQQVVLTFDEVQAGFGRCGRRWGFELYGVVPDLICCGKGISSSLPLGAVIGREVVMDLFPAGSMTSTHTGNPVCCAAAVANIKALEGGLIDNARRMGEVLAPRIRAIGEAHPERIGVAKSVGLVGGLQCVHPGTTDPDPDTAHAVIERCLEQGLLFFGAVGVGGACVKICPPLCITREGIEEGCDVLAATVAEVTA